MKKLPVLIFVVCSQVALGQGTFAGPLKSSIGKMYKQESELTFLKGFTPRGGALLSEANDPDKFAVSWYSNASTFIAIFETVSDQNERQILDILTLDHMTADLELKIGDCKDGDNENVAFMALVKTSKAERWRARKAWLCNRDKIRIEAWPATHVSCLGMVGDD